MSAADCYHSRSAWRSFVSIGTGAAFHLYRQCQGSGVWNGDPSIYNSYLFPMRNYGSVSGSTSWDGTFHRADAFVSDRHRRNENYLDLPDLSALSYTFRFISLLSCVVAPDDPHAGGLLFLCAEKGAERIGMVCS